MDISMRRHIGKAFCHRSFDLDELEFRDGEDGQFNFEGVASVVDKPYLVRDAFGEFSETIKAGAFDKAIEAVGKRDAAQDVFMYVNHRHQDVPMASRNAGTLKLAANPHLRANASLDTARQDVVIARSAVQRGEMTQMSIGFTVNANRDEWNKDYTKRTIHEVNLREVSIVPIGANPYTSAAMRSFDPDMFDDLDPTLLTPDFIERAINFFTSLRADQQPEQVEVNPFAERDAADLARALKRARSPYVL